MGYSRNIRKIIKLIISLGVIYILVFLFINNTEKDHKNDIEEVSVFIANKLIKAGDRLEINNIDSIVVREDLVPKNRMEVFGKNKDIIAKIDIYPNTLMTKDMLLEKNVSEDLRYQDFKGIEVLSDLEAGEYIDVRYKNNETDLAILCKKEVIEIDNKYIKLMTNEKERQKYAKFSGNKGQFYIVKYIEPFYQ
ncbi:MAG: hypothetical protein N4A47_05460 [Clostridia bacterium]|jgi:hypothetical protein|nr:hypothetical protein [Clostridia bacterium]